MLMRKRLGITAVFAVVSFAVPHTAAADWVFTPFIGWNFGSSADVTGTGGPGFKDKFEKKIDYGASLMGMGGGPVGFEIDFGYSPNFFETSTTASGFQFASSSNVTTLMGNLVVCAKSGTVRRIDDDFEPVEPVRQGLEQVVEVALAQLRLLPDPADPGTGGPLPVLAQPGLDRVLQLVGELVPAAGEELQPVVRHRVVAGRDDRAEVRPQRRGQVGHRRGGDDSDVDHVDTGAGQAGDDGRAEELPGRPGVAADDGHRPVPLEGTDLGQHVGGRDGQVERQLGGQVAVGQPAHTVGAEDAAHQEPELPLRRRRVSAWSTGEPCGPSSGRTSCAPWPAGHG